VRSGEIRLSASRDRDRYAGLGSCRLITEPVYRVRLGRKKNERADSSLSGSKRDAGRLLK
jgi:hypothetical protein